jgi:predicted nucleic acid-binding protein
MPGAFFDTNILLYLVSADDARADRAETLLAAGGTISAQVLNEFAAVALRKLALTPAEIGEALTPIQQLCRVAPLTAATFGRALALVERYRFSWYHALIVAAALDANCDTLYTEDLQHGQRIDRSLHVVNPFIAAI